MSKPCTSPLCRYLEATGDFPVAYWCEGYGAIISNEIVLKGCDRHEPAERIQQNGTNMKAVLRESIQERREAAAMAKLTPKHRGAVLRLEAEG